MTSWEQAKPVFLGTCWPGIKGNPPRILLPGWVFCFIGVERDNFAAWLQRIRSRNVCNSALPHAENFPTGKSELHSRRSCRVASRVIYRLPRGFGSSALKG